MAARNAKGPISTILRKNRGLRTVYDRIDLPHGSLIISSKNLYNNSIYKIFTFVQVKGHVICELYWQFLSWTTEVS